MICGLVVPTEAFASYRLILTSSLLVVLSHVDCLLMTSVEEVCLPRFFFFFFFFF